MHRSVSFMLTLTPSCWCHLLFKHFLTNSFMFLLSVFPPCSTLFTVEPQIRTIRWTLQPVIEKFTHDCKKEHISIQIPAHCASGNNQAQPLISSHCATLYYPCTLFQGGKWPPNRWEKMFLSVKRKKSSQTEEWRMCSRLFQTWQVRSVKPGDNKTFKHSRRKKGNSYQSWINWTSHHWSQFLFEVSGLPDGLL